MKKYLIDRKELPYDAMVNDPSWLIPIPDTKEGDLPHDAKTEELHADQIHGRDIPL